MRHARLFLILLVSIPLWVTNALYAQVPACASYTAPTDQTSGLGTSPALTWVDVATETGYKVYFGTNASSLTLVTTTAANVTTYSPGGVVCGRRYYWRIVPTNGSGDATGCSTYSFFTSPFISNAPIANAVLKYDFTSGSGNDLLGSGNDGTLVNSPSTTTDRFGVASNALSFNGTTQYVNSATQYTIGGNFTTVLWFKTNTTLGGPLVGFYGSVNAYDNTAGIYMKDSDGKLYFALDNNGSGGYVLSTTKTYNDNQWHQVAVTVSGGTTMTMYIDDQLITSSTRSSGPTFSGNWRIGGTGGGRTSLFNGTLPQYFAGSIDDVVSYSSVLSATQITTMYNAVSGVSAPTKTPICGNPINLTANSASPACIYSWSGPSSFSSSSQNPTIASGNSANSGLYTLTASRNGCSTLGYVSIAVTASLAQVPTDYLFGSYSFSGNTNDASTNGYNATAVNSPTLTTDRFGVANSAYSFTTTQWNDNGPRIYVGTQVTSPQIFSLGAWFKTSSTQRGHIAGFGNSTGTGSGGGYNDRNISIGSDGKINFSIRATAGGSPTIITSPFAYNDNAWHFATATFSTSGMNLYLDGVLVASNPSLTSGSDYQGYWKIGKEWISGQVATGPDNGYDGFNGSIDDVNIYTKELSAAEIAVMYANPNGVGSNTPVCTGSTINLNVVSVGSVTYSWTGPNSFTSTSQNPSIASATSAKAGTYNLAITSSNGCSYSTYSVNVVVDPVVSNNTVTANQVLCATGTPTAITGSTATGGNGVINYQWQLSTTSASSGFSVISSASNATGYSPTSISVTTWYRRKVVSGGCSDTTAIVKKAIKSSAASWLGTTSSWNTSSNWCSGVVPTSTTDAYIESAALNMPTISGSQDVRNITIQSGATVNISGSNVLSVYGDWSSSNGTVSTTSGTVRFTGTASQANASVNTIPNVKIDKSSGSLSLTDTLKLTGKLTLTLGSVTTNGKLVLDFNTGGGIDPSGSGTISGNVIGKRNVTWGWHYIGTPFTGSTYADINDDVALSTSKFYLYKENNTSTNSALGWTGIPAPYDASVTLVGSKYTGGPTNMNGYAVKFPSTTELDIAGTYTHSSGASYTTGALSLTSSGNAASDGWHIISNPFPSYIDWRLLTLNNISTTMTYSVNKNNDGYNVDATYKPAGGLPEAYTNDASPYIPPMQAFWIQTTADGGTVTVANSARVVQPSTSSWGGSVPYFYRTAASDVKTLKLSVKNTKCSDEAIVRFSPLATEAFDGDFDAYKFESDQCPAIYSYVGEDLIAINSLPEIVTDRAVPLGFTANFVGANTISVKQIDGFENMESVMLYDKVTKTSQNLLQDPVYNFISANTDPKSRFVLNFTPLVITATASASEKSVAIGAVQNKVVMTFNNIKANTTDVSIVNVLGQEVYKAEQVNIASGIAELTVDNVQSSVYVVRTIIDGQVYAKEVYLSR